jgi:hypothetical protein
MNKKFEYRPDSGRLMATQSKRSEKSPDYWGEIAINVNDLTKVEKTPEGLLVFKLNGWKKKTKAGTVFLSLSIDRYIKEQPQEDEDIPF